MVLWSFPRGVYLLPANVGIPPLLLWSGASPSGVTNDKRLELKETMIVLTGGSILGACLVDIGEPYEVKLATFYGS